MKLTSVAYAQHIGRMFRRHWRIQRKRFPIITKAEQIMADNEIRVYTPDEIVKEKHEFVKFQVVGLPHSKPLANDETHPLYNERECLMYRDHNVLLEGLTQGKILTKTVEIKKGLPEEIEKLFGAYELPEQDKLIQRCIFMSHLFDAMQEKLPIRKDPERPAWVFPRDYGITHKRRNDLLSSKLVHLCELACGRTVNHGVVQDEMVSVPFEKDGDLIQFELTVDFMINSAKALPAYAYPQMVEITKDIELPDISPLNCTITLTKENIYEIRDIFPIDKRSQYPNVHTAIIHYNQTEVLNLYETPVTEDQILGRTLLKAFAVAAGNAKQRFGLDVKILPEPITLQCVHTDGRLFHFAVLQLNTLDLDGTEGIKNIFWSLPRIALFDSCTYEKGVPTLTGYNDEVFKRLLAFYSNGLKL